MRLMEDLHRECAKLEDLTAGSCRANQPPYFQPFSLTAITFKCQTIRRYMECCRALR